MSFQSVPAPAPLKIPGLKVCFSDSDIQVITDKIKKCLMDGQVAQGENLQELEALFAELVYPDKKTCDGAPGHALALSSGGTALEAAMLALEIKDKEVLVPTNTVLATASAVIAAGGSVNLLDMDLDTLAPSVETIEAAIGPNTVGVIVVHLGGIISKDLPKIRELCDSRGLWLFEDCAHAHGSTLNDIKAGRFGVGGAYSLFATKVITSGEGGMFVTEDDKLADKVMLLRNYGKRKLFENNCEEVGHNWRLNEFAAIVGVTQLKRLDEFIAWRERIAALYTKQLGDMPALKPILPQGRSSLYKYVVLLPPEADRKRIKDLAKEKGISFSGGIYDQPLHRQPVAARLGWLGAYPNADAFSERHLCLPMYYGMTDDEAGYVIETLAAVMKSA